MLEIAAAAVSMVGAAALCIAAWLFARSLLPGATPLVLRFAQATDPHAGDRCGAPRYLRGLTTLWASLLTASALLFVARLTGAPLASDAIALLAPPLLTCGLFFGERPLRRRLFGADTVGPAMEQWQTAMRIFREELLGQERIAPHQSRGEQPVPCLRDSERTLLIWRDRACSGSDLLRAVARLVPQLPPGERVLVACDDRAVFLYALLAVWSARRTAVMPSPDLKLSASGLDGVDFDCVITDRADVKQGEVPVLCIARDWLDPARLPRLDGPAPGAVRVPALLPSHPAVVFFTSGSTGRPATQMKTWGQMCAGADAMGALLHMHADALLAGTVVHSHMFGFEMLVMQVLRGCCALYAHRIVYPSDLATFAARPESGKWLVTTPYHLQVFVDNGPLPGGLARILSATMPLAGELAQRAEASSGAEVHEIYGSTEAGCIATRRTVHGDGWKLAADLRLLLDDDGRATLQGVRLGGRLPLRDRLVLAGDSFEIAGRDVDTVKIAGKRTSLQALSAILRDIDGVYDGIFVDGTTFGKARLAALVVAPSLSPRAVRAALALRIDAAFLPRPLVLVPALPRDANGKLPAHAVAALIAAGTPKTRHQREMTAETERA